MIDAAIARVLVEASLRVCVVALAVATVLKLARVESSTVRHAAWTSVVVAMLLMPLLPYVLPSFELPGRSRVATAVASVPDELPFVGDVDLAEKLFSTSLVAPEPVATGASLSTSSSSSSVVPAMPLWLVAAIVIYAIGLGMLCVRWILAARFIAKLRRQSTPIATNVAVDVFESPLAATPITVGALSPWIVLPTEWKSWSPAKLAGVLAHERAHVERRDPLIAIVAYVNRCIFWFHPLAWWLERKLAATAEDAADDAGARAMGQEREYAAVLVEMAEVVRQHGGRVAWQGVGVDGNGMLSKRIDRLLSGHLFLEVSRMKKVLIALVCAGAVFVAVACRPQIDVAPLQADPKIAEQTAANRVASQEVDQAKAMTREAAEALEAKVKATPEDLDSRRKLLIFYRWSGWNVMPSDVAMRNRRAHVLWLIEHRPDDSVTASWASLSPTGDFADPEGYELSKRLWLAHANTKSASIDHISRAASVLERGGYLAEAEAMLLKGKAAYPANARWAGSLGGLYAGAIAGVRPSTLGVRGAVDPELAKTPYALATRKRMESTTDAVLLANVASGLDVASHGPNGVDEGLRQLAREYVSRAQTLDPSAPRVSMVARTLSAGDLQRRVSDLRKAATSDPAKSVDPVRFVDSVMALPVAEQFALLPSVADELDMSGESADYYRHDAVAAKAAWDGSRRAATSLLTIASQFTSDPNYGPAIFRANCLLGLSALRAGNRAESVKYLTLAADAPASPNFGPPGMPGRYYYLATYLLKYGERESVASFYDKYARLIGPMDGRHQSMLDNAAAIRAGRMPNDYQRFFDRVDNATKK